MKSKKGYLLIIWMLIFTFMAGGVEAAAFGGAKLPSTNGQTVKKEKTAEEWFEQGLAYHDQYLYEKAIQAYTKAIGVNNQIPEIYYNRGCAYTESRNYDAALADFTKAIELSPQEADAYYNRGVVYDAKESFEQALENYNQALAINPQYADAYYNKAVALENLGRSEEAKEYYAAFIQYAPANDSSLAFARERLQLLS